MKEIIELQSRNKDYRVWLEYLTDNLYIYNDNILLSMNVSHKGNGHYNFIDQSDGPMIAVGSKIEGMTVQDIEYCKTWNTYIIELK